MSTITSAKTGQAAATLESVIRERRARVGKPVGVTDGGAYWVALDVRIERRGGDGIGQNAPETDVYLRVRHYRDGAVEALVVDEAWHQNSGYRYTVQMAPAALAAETIEDVAIALARLRARAKIADLVAAIPELPVHPAGPDE